MVKRGYAIIIVMVVGLHDIARPFVHGHIHILTVCDHGILQITPSPPIDNI